MVDRDIKILLKKLLLYSLKRKIKLYLVGGYLRDLLLKREVKDLDFCMKRGSIKFSQGLSKILKSSFVILDRERGYCRLLKKIKDKTYILDFTDFRGKNLEEDLFWRDFTINAMALELKDFVDKDFKIDKKIIIDPFGGINDLEKKVIRLVNKDGFLDDPLRILRAFSFSASLKFKIEKKTIFFIKKYAPLLSKVAKERIRDEIFKILNLDFSYPYIRMMDEYKVLEVIFPCINNMRNVYQGPYHHLDVFEHSLETLRQLEILFKEFRKDKDLNSYLDEIISAGRFRRALIKLASFFHDIGKPKAKRWQDGKVKFHGHERIGLSFIEEISQDLKLSNSEKDILKTIVLWHLRPGYLADLEVISQRAKFRFFRDTAKEALSVLLVSLADQRASRGRLTSRKQRQHHEKVVKSLIRQYFERQRQVPLKRLINGYDLINKFKLKPSPLFGKILKEIEEMQAIGKIKTKKEALEWVDDFLKHNKI